MNANDMTAQLINELQYLMKNHEKLREIVKQNIKDKQDLGFLQKEDQLNQEKPPQKEELQQVQTIGKKQKRELKFLNNEYIDQIREKNRIRKQSRKRVQLENFTEQAVKIIKIQDFQNSFVQNEEVNISQDQNIMEHEEIKKQVYDNNAKQDEIFHKGALNYQLQKEVCNLCKSEFKSILVLTHHLETSHQISFSQQELQLLKKQEKQ